MIVWSRNRRTDALIKNTQQKKKNSSSIYHLANGTSWTGKGPEGSKMNRDSKQLYESHKCRIEKYRITINMDSKKKKEIQKEPKERRSYYWGNDSWCHDSKQGQSPYSVKSDTFSFYFIFLGMKYIWTSKKIKQS